MAHVLQAFNCALCTWNNGWTQGNTNDTTFQRSAQKHEHECINVVWSHSEMMKITGCKSSITQLQTSQSGDIASCAPVPSVFRCLKVWGGEQESRFITVMALLCKASPRGAAALNLNYQLALCTKTAWEVRHQHKRTLQQWSCLLCLCFSCEQCAPALPRHYFYRWCSHKTEHSSKQRAKDSKGWNSSQWGREPCRAPTCSLEGCFIKKLQWNSSCSRLLHEHIKDWWSVGVPNISALLHGCSWASWKFSGPFTISRHNVEGCAQARSDLTVWCNMHAREIKVKRVLQTTALLFASSGSLSRLILTAEGVVFRESSTTPLCTSQNVSQTQSATSWWTEQQESQIYPSKTKNRAKSCSKCYCWVTVTFSQFEKTFF